jgi:hypothetical protein
VFNEGTGNVVGLCCVFTAALVLLTLISHKTLDLTDTVVSRNISFTIGDELLYFELYSVGKKLLLPVTSGIY